jgi:hypothetical protein
MAIRLISRIVLIILVAVIALVVITWIFRAPLAARILTKVLHTPVQVDDLTFSLNHIQVTGLRIKNPSGSQVQNAFTVESVYVDMHVMDLFNDVIHINKILVDKPMVGLELYNIQGSDNNWERMINRINDGTGESSNEKHTHKKKKNAFDKKKVIISLFQINDLTINAYSVPTHAKLNISPIPHMSFKDIGAPSGIPASHAANIICRAIIAHIAKDAAMPEIIKNLQKLPESLLKFLPDEMKGHGIFSWPIFGK